MRFSKGQSNRHIALIVGWGANVLREASKGVKTTCCSQLGGPQVGAGLDLAPFWGYFVRPFELFLQGISLQAMLHSKLSCTTVLQ